VAEIRPAEPSDEAALAALDRATWSTLSSPAPLPGPGRAFFDESNWPEDVLVAMVDGEIAGYVRLVRATPLAVSDHVLTVNGIAVDPARRRCGIGRALVAAAAREARERGARRLTLRVLDHNEAALALYESAGFVVEGVQRGEFLLDGEYRNDVLMALDLTGDTV
jgi:ribosomal protein S18 acetylase RimI-like enzyme